MRNLLLSSFLIIVLFGCKLGHYGKLLPLPPPPPPDFYTLKPVFSDHFDSFLFKTNIRIYGKNFSGLLVTKQVQPSDYRVIFTTELGMKLFDFEFTDTAFTLHYCIPQFNRTALLKIIRHDIEILLMNKMKSVPVDMFSDTRYRYTIFRNMQNIFTDYYFFDSTKGNKLSKIEHAKGQIKKTTFTLDNYVEDIPGHIQVKHHDIRLKIELTLLKK